MTPWIISIRIWSTAIYLCSCLDILWGTSNINEFKYAHSYYFFLALSLCRIFDHFGVLSCNMLLYVPWAELGTVLKMAMLFHASSSVVCVRPRQSSGKVNASVKDLNHPTVERFTLTGGTWKLVNKNTNRDLFLFA